LSEVKAKYMKVNRNIMNLEQNVIIDGQVFEGVQNFRHLGTLINSKIVKSEETKSRIDAGNRSVQSSNKYLDLEL
jgi:hypothetical protein